MMNKVYGKPGCMQCKFTVKELARLDIPHEYIDITVNPMAEETVKEMGFTSLPVVVTNNDKWSGFKVDKIRSLTIKKES